MTLPTRPLVIIMPVYEDSESAGQLLVQLAAKCSVKPYIVAVDDGSIRSPLSADAISKAGLEGEVLHLARNMGHQRAIAVGIAYVAKHFDAAAIVVMDSDGEDKPESIEPLLTALRAGNVDVVVAERRKRSESLRFRTFYVVYRKLFQLMTGRVIRFGNFTGMTLRAAKRLASMQEVWVHLASSLMVSRLRIGKVATDRGVRLAGQSQMNFVQLTLHGLRSIMVFAEDVLVRVGLFCVVVAVTATLLLATSVLLKSLGIATPGWFSVAAGILVVILLQAGVLTFVTLMITGLIRGAPPITSAELNQLIAEIERTGGVPPNQTAALAG